MLEAKILAMMLTDCYVMHTYTNLFNIRISRDMHPIFMLISGRVQGLSATYEKAHVGERPFDPDII